MQFHASRGACVHIAVLTLVKIIRTIFYAARHAAAPIALHTNFIAPAGQVFRRRYALPRAPGHHGRHFLSGRVVSPRLIHGVYLFGNGIAAHVLHVKITDIIPPTHIDCFIAGQKRPFIAVFDGVLGLMREIRQKQIDLKKDFKWYKGIVLAMAAGAVAWLIVGQISAVDVPLASKIANIAYALGDMALLFCIVALSGAVAEYKDAKFGKIWRAFFAGVAVIFIADMFYVLFPDQYLQKEFPFLYIDVLYGSGYLLFGYALVATGFAVVDAKQKILDLENKILGTNNS